MSLGLQFCCLASFSRVGLPHTQPDFVIDGSDEDARAFVSWNGATEVATWMFAVGDDASSLKSSTKFARTGFESNSTLPDDSASHIAVVALDSDGGCLGVSKAISIEGSEDPQDCNCEAIEGLDAADTPDTGSKDDEDEDDDSSAGITQMDTLAVVAFALVGLLVI